MEELKNENDELKKENETLKKENQELKERLSKYTNPIFAKNYYENNKEKVLEKRALRYKKEKGIEKGIKKDIK